MQKKILISSTDLMMVQFLLPHVKNLSENGFDVDIACSDVGGRISEIKEKTEGCVRNFYTVKLKRSPFTLSNLKGLKDLKKIINGGSYDIVWTNEPVMGVMTRIAAKKARKKGAKVLYMAHGFHFYKGAPLVNRVIYYSLEKHFAKITDLLVTINTEDLAAAKKFKCKRAEYVHGIGINTDRLIPSNSGADIRKDLGLSQDDFLLLSIGELNKNKNQQVIIKALAEIKDGKIHYLICGKGDNKQTLQNLATSLGVSENVHFLGYRKDIVDICNSCDLFVMPSLREGLGLAALEAMYCGLPLVTSGIRGLNDIMQDGVTGYKCDPYDHVAFAKAITAIKEDSALSEEMRKNNKETVKPFCIDKVKEEILNLISGL